MILSRKFLLFLILLNVCMLATLSAYASAKPDLATPDIQHNQIDHGDTYHPHLIS